MWGRIARTRDGMKLRTSGLAAVLALGCAAAFAASVARPSITPVQAELTTDVTARLLKVGAPVFARVTVDWQGTGCVLRSGAILEARVSSVLAYNKTDKRSEVDLAFTRAQCGDRRMGPFALMIAALAAPPEASDMGILSDPMPVNSVPSGYHGTASIAAIKSGYAVNLMLESSIYQFPMSDNLQMGTVAGIKGLKLSVGSGPGNASVLTSTRHDVSLGKHTLLLLVPEQGTFPRMVATAGGAPAAASGASIPSASSPAPPPQPPASDIEACEPPQCNMALPAGNSIDESKPEASISIHQLGYAPRPQRIMKAFDNDDALAWLGPDELLVGFNPHILAPRHTLGKSGSTVRVIRAVLVDTRSRRVTRNVDWELPDDHQYLWQLSSGRVLVHVGSELRVYGAGLKILNRVPLDGPLAFVRVTPNGSFMAVGVVNERHSPELHAELRENLNAEPEEDVNVLVLNSSFEIIARSSARSGLVPPTLLNEGQARLLAAPNHRYRIALLTWDNHPSTLARFTSSCTPELTSIAPDLLFLVSCNKQADDVREYRILRSDGKLELKGGALPTECGHSAEGNAASDGFVVKVVESTLPIGEEEGFSPANFSSEELRVYRATDGKRLLGVRVGSPSPSRDGYALAPDGSQLAVLTRDQIAVYSVPAM